MPAPSNLSFETAGAGAGEAAAWTVTTVATARELAEFAQGGAWETYENGWANTPFETEISSSDSAEFDADVLVSPESFEDFEEGWDPTYLFQLAGTAAGVFDIGTTSENVEDYEEQWNEASAVFTANFTTDVLTSAAHPLRNGEVIRLSNTGGALPAGLNTTTAYYVVTATTNTFQVALTDMGAPVNFSSNGTGTHRWHRGNQGIFETIILADVNALFNAGAETVERYEADEGWDPGYQTSIGSSSAATFGTPPEAVETFEDVKGVQSMTVNTTTNRILCTAHGFTAGNRCSFETDGVLPDGLQTGNMYFVLNVTANDFQVERQLGDGALDILDVGLGAHLVRADPVVYWTDEETI